MILNEARRLVYLSFRCLAFSFRISRYHKVHWARSIDSYGRGTWHAVAHVMLTHSMFAVDFKNSNAQPLYRDTVPLSSTLDLTQLHV